MPVLVIDGQPLTENVAILTWLNRTYPEAELLPKTSNELDAVRQTADLAFFSSTVHPLVTRFARPGQFVAGRSGLQSSARRRGPSGASILEHD